MKMVQRPSESPFRIRLGPAGLHLFNRSSGLNVLLDEVRSPPSAWTTGPRQVSIALTNACDLACEHCFAPKSRGSLPLARVTAWLDELDAHGTLGVGFGGGEPTLYPEFTALCRHAATRTGLAVTFTTHGHHLSDALIGELAGHVHFVRISMDGVGATYEAIRRRSYATLRQRLERLRTFAPFGINYVVNRQTMGELDAAVRVATEVGASEFLLLPEQPVNGRGGIDASTRRALSTWVSHYRGSPRLAVSELGAGDLPTCNPFPGEEPLHAYVHIDAHGLLKRSSYAQRGVNIGEQGIIAALQSLADEPIRNEYETLE